MVWTAFSCCKRIYIAGDDDQAIYQWSGADVGCFLDINGHKEILKESWRLPNNMVTFANKISSKIEQRVDKEYIGKKEDGTISYVNNLDEVHIRPNESYLCLARNNCYLPLYEEWLCRNIQPYQLKGEDYITAKDVEAIKVYEGIRKSRIMTAVQEAKFSRLRKSDSPLSDPWYDAFNWDDNKILLARSLIADKRIGDPSLFNVSTIHSVKGGEADHVIVMTDITAPVKEQLETDPDSEHRVFYVAATRARKSITIVKPQTKYCYGGFDRC
jgi:ATP-dependent exoDNAse (exonuclease V) beta subunit